MAFHFNPGKRGSARKPSVPSPVSGVGREKCPYNPHHEVSTDKMEAHLDRCRHEYKRSGKELTYFSCKYNYRHQIPVQELLYHESRCKDGEYVPTYLLNVALEASQSGEKLEPLEPSKEELDRMYEGLYIDTFIGSASFGKPIPFSKIPPAGYIDPKLVDEWNQVAPDKKDLGMEEKRAEVQPSTSTEGVINEEDEEPEEEWNEGDRPMFSYMQNFLYPTKPLTMFPPMLKTKSQRREFVKWNTRWKDSIEKDGQDEEEEEAPMGVLKIPAAFSISADEIAHEPLQPLKKAKLEKKEEVVDELQGAVGGVASLPREIIIPVEDIVFDPTNPRAKVQSPAKEVVIKEREKVGDYEATSEVEVATWAEEMALKPIVEGSGSVVIPQEIEEDKEDKGKELSNEKVEDTANREEVSGEQEKKEEEEPKLQLEESEKAVEEIEEVGDEATTEVEITASTEEMAMEPIGSAPVLQEIKEDKEESPTLEEIPKSNEIEKELFVEKVDDTSHLEEASGEESEKKEEGEPKLERSEKVGGESSLEMTNVTREIIIPVEDIVFDSTSSHTKVQPPEKEVVKKMEKVGDGEATSEVEVTASAEEMELEPGMERSGSAPIPQEIQERKDGSQSLEQMPKSDEIEKEVSEEKGEVISNLEEVPCEQEKNAEEEPKLEESETVVGHFENEMSDTISAPIDSLKTETDDGEGQGTSQEDSEKTLEVEVPASVSIPDELVKPEETLEVVRIPPIRMSVSRGAWGPAYWQNLESGADKDENEPLSISNEEKEKEVGNDASAILEGEKEDPSSAETPETEENGEGPKERTRSTLERGESTLEELKKDFVQRVIDVVSEILTPNWEAESVGGDEQNLCQEVSEGIKEVFDEATDSVGVNVKDEEETESMQAGAEPEAQFAEDIQVEKVKEEKTESLQEPAPVSPEADKAPVLEVDEDSVVIEIETEAVVKESVPAIPEQVKVEATATSQPISEVSEAKFDEEGLVLISNEEKLEAKEDTSPSLKNANECSSLEENPEAYAEIAEDQREKKESILEEAKQLKLEETDMSVGQVENDASESCSPLMKPECDEGEEQMPSHDASGGKQETAVSYEAKESGEGTVAQLPVVIQAEKMEEERSNDNCQAGPEPASTDEVTAAVEAVVEVVKVKEDSVVIDIEPAAVTVVKESESENAEKVEPTTPAPQPFQEVSESKAESVETEPIISSKEPEVTVPEIEPEAVVKESESGNAAVEATTIPSAEGVETEPTASSQEPKETPEILAPQITTTVPEPEQGVTESKAKSIIPPPPEDKEDPTSDGPPQETTTAVPQLAPEISEAETTERDQSEPPIEEESITPSEQPLQISPENLGEDAVPVQAEPTPALEAPSSELKVIIVGKKEMKGKIKKDAFTQTDFEDE